MNTLESLKWVSSVEKVDLNEIDYSDSHYYDEDDNTVYMDTTAYIITTKPKSLRCILTSKILVNKDEQVTGLGSDLREPKMIFMPSYRILLTENTYGVRIALAEKPGKSARERFMAFPNAGHSTMWDTWHDVCFGEYKEYYNDAHAWIKKAEVVAEYLQSCVTEGGQETSKKLYTQFAYGLGLVPKRSIIQKQ